MSIAPLRPRRLVITSITVIAAAVLGIAVLAWPLPSPPDAADAAAIDRYAEELIASPRARALDPDGHARLAEARDHGDILDAARELRSAIRLPRWTAVFAFLLCAVAGAMSLARARRPDPAISREAVGLAIFATTLSMLFVGWTSILTSTVVTTITAGSAGALMISGRVIPEWLAGRRHGQKIVLGLALALAGIIGRRSLAPEIHAEAGEILLHAIPMLVCTFALVGGVLLAASNIAVLLLRR